MDKNNLIKIYSVNYFPNTIEFSDIKYFYQYDPENSKLKKLKNDEVKQLSSDIHAFYLQFNFKKFYKI